MQIEKESQALPRKKGGYALMLTLLFLGIMLITLASTLKWTSTSVGLTSRNNYYNSAVYAAESATETVVSKMDYDFVNLTLRPTMSNYTSLIPAQTDWPIQYNFSDGNGNPDKTGIEVLAVQVQTNLNTRFAGLYGIVNTYRVTSTAQTANRLFNPAATVSQQFQLALIPVFQFAVFYNLDLEINPGAAMLVTGKVHSNGEIFSAPPAPLEFKDYVTSVGLMHNTRSTNDPTGGSATKPLFDLGYVEQVGSLTLPIGTTDNSPTNAVQIMDPPQPGEDPQSPLYKQRLYNNAMIIVSNNSAGDISVTAGLWDGFVPVQPDVTNAVGKIFYSFVTNITFYDYREKKTVYATQVDVAKFNTWLNNTTTVGGHTLDLMAQVQGYKGVNSVYVQNKQGAGGLSAVRVVNGAQLPPNGFSVATAQPLYVMGNFNLNNGDTTPGLANTSQTRPSSLLGDSVTILSGGWKDSYNSSTALGSRPAVDTTVNAALLTGIVQSGPDAANQLHYSGGVENLTRLLENWSGNTFTYNGSMVVMFSSRSATNFWQNTGIYYNAPKRKWAFDVNFLDQNRLPPLSPAVRKLFRDQWHVLPSST